MTKIALNISGKKEVGEKCEPTKGDDDCIQGQVCQDHDADGRWTCECLPGYFIPNDDGFCRPGRLKQTQVLM